MLVNQVKNVLLATTALLSLSRLAQAEVTFTQINEFDIPEANQGIGVDAEFFMQQICGISL